MIIKNWVYVVVSAGMDVDMRKVFIFALKSHINSFSLGRTMVLLIFI